MVTAHKRSFGDLITYAEIPTAMTLSVVDRCHIFCFNCYRALRDGERSDSFVSVVVPIGIAPSRNHNLYVIGACVCGTENGKSIRVKRLARVIGVNTQKLGAILIAVVIDGVLVPCYLTSHVLYCYCCCHSRHLTLSVIGLLDIAERYLCRGYLNISSRHRYIFGNNCRCIGPSGKGISRLFRSFRLVKFIPFCTMINIYRGYHCLTVFSKEGNRVANFLRSRFELCSINRKTSYSLNIRAPTSKGICVLIIISLYRSCSMICGHIAFRQFIFF